MSETQTLGPCTECGTPRDACTAPDYCCDECLHFPPDWDGYAPTQPDEPTDVREQIVRVYRTWPGDASFTAELFADAVLALPAVRDALAAQETLRRVEALADRLVVIADETEQAVSYTDGEYRADQLGLAMGYRRGGLFIRRALAGDS